MSPTHPLVLCFSTSPLPAGAIVGSSDVEAEGKGYLFLPVCFWSPLPLSQPLITPSLCHSSQLSDTPCHSDCGTSPWQSGESVAALASFSPSLSEHSQGTPTVSILPHPVAPSPRASLCTCLPAVPPSSLSCSSLIPSEKLFWSNNLLKFLMRFPLPGNTFFDILSKLHPVQMSQQRKEC